MILGPELALWDKAGQRPLFWWRDDDARVASEPLDRLLGLARRHQLPITLACVPDGDMAALARLADAQPTVSLAVHGFRHENRAEPGRPSCEINDADSLLYVTAELNWAVARFEAAGIKPTVFVPPWNAIHPTLLRALPGSAITQLSGFGDSTQHAAGVRRLDTHLDLMRWKGTPRFRGEARFLLKLRRHLAVRRKTRHWRQPIGLLTHHLDHDPAAWRFLESFLGASRSFDWF